METPQETMSAPVVGLSEAPKLPEAPKPEAPKMDDPEFASKFAALTRKQKELFMKEKELKEKMALVEKYERLEKLKGENPYKFVQEQGIDFDSLAQAALKDGQPPGPEDKISKLEAELARITGTLEERKKLEEENLNKYHVDQLKKRVEDLVKSSPDRYELLGVEQDFDSVLAVAQAHYEQTLAETGDGEVLTLEQAADKLEATLEGRLIKYKQVKKLGFYTPEKSAPPSAESMLEAGAKDSLPTISGSMSPTTGAPASRGYESPDEAKARIAREFNAKLRKTL